MIFFAEQLFDVKVALLNVLGLDKVDLNVFDVEVLEQFFKLFFFLKAIVTFDGPSDLCRGLFGSCLTAVYR